MALGRTILVCAVCLSLFSPRVGASGAAGPQTGALPARAAASPPLVEEVGSGGARDGDARASTGPRAQPAPGEEGAAIEPRPTKEEGPLPPREGSATGSILQDAAPTLEPTKEEAPLPPREGSAAGSIPQDAAPTLEPVNREGGTDPGAVREPDAVPEAALPTSPERVPRSEAPAPTAVPIAPEGPLPGGAAVSSPPDGGAPDGAAAGVRGSLVEAPRVTADPTPISDEAGEAAVASEERPRIQLHARVFARAGADERADFQRNFSLPSARLGATAKLSLLEAEVTADFADKDILKDAFIRLSAPGKALRVYGGRFKAPFLARRLQGSWSLPRIGRGMVSDLLIDDEELAGRRLGLMFEGRLRNLWNLRAQLGVFEGGRDALGIKTGREDVSARVAVRPIDPLTVGTDVYVVSAFSSPDRSMVVGVDATWKAEALRVSAEATGGTISLGPYTSQSAMAAWAFPLTSGRRWQLEPVLGAEALQVHTAERSVGHAMTAGMNLLYGDWFKAMLQGERALKPGDLTPAFAITFQLAAQLSVE